MIKRLTTLTASVTATIATATLLVSCGAKDSTRTCAPANSWSQPAWNCSMGEAPEPEPEPEAEPEPAVEETPIKVMKAVLKGDKIEILEKVQFETGSADILEESFGLLDEVAEILEKNPQITKIRIEGHTDSKGGKRMNKRLSGKRAKSVRDYLADKGVDRDRMSSKGYGQAKPIADNDTDEGRAENRRVEFNILEGKGVEGSDE